MDGSEYLIGKSDGPSPPLLYGGKHRVARRFEASVVRCLELFGWDITESRVQPPGVVPVDPLLGNPFDILELPQWPGAKRQGRFLGQAVECTALELVEGRDDRVTPLRERDVFARGRLENLELRPRDPAHNGFRKRRPVPPKNFAE